MCNDDDYEDNDDSNDDDDDDELQSPIRRSNQFHLFQNLAVSNQQTDKLTYRNGTQLQGPNSEFMKTPYNNY